ncbi:sensor histidine kinase [Sphingomicrobium nitratireducens]|uniref:sensor histidine kinase n=1 Tax=Sphingomicrobium nitratireducens TaxID=2964666 RepID=UPI00223F3404|nr:HAMP domain-containing sensor histidine kinase [Sphingomicrobium nitratireducens]
MGDRPPVRFDDRLATLLTLPVADAHDRAVRWRQLVELAAQAGAEDEESAAFIAALAVARADRSKVAREVRAAAGRAIAGRPLPLKLLELFAEDALVVNAPVLAAARLGKPRVRHLAAIADEETRRFLAALHPGLEEMEQPDFAGLAAKVEERRSAKTAPEPPAPAPVVPRAEPSVEPGIEWPPAPPPPAPERAPAKGGLFRWESGPGGDVRWVEGVPRGAMVGRSIASEDFSASVADAFAARAPFDEVALSIAPLGDYVISGEPAFDPEDGRFLGYHGHARPKAEARPIATRPRRSAAAPKRASRPAATTRNVDSLRELVHEIKTPLNAIIGFAEIIDGQYLGPAHRRYRERAAEIVTQARILLGAIEDLDLAARVQSGQVEAAGAPSNASELVGRAITALQPRAERAGVTVRADIRGEDFHCALDEEVAMRLVTRLVGALVEAAGEGETLRVALARPGSHCKLSVNRPASIEGLSEARLLDPALSLEGEGKPLLGLGFSLRLVRGLIRIAGGELAIEPDAIALHLPTAIS